MCLLCFHDAEGGHVNVKHCSVCAHKGTSLQNEKKKKVHKALISSTITIMRERNLTQIVNDWSQHSKSMENAEDIIRPNPQDIPYGQTMING